MTYHGRMMNIPCDNASTMLISQATFAEGHKRARHAAAAIAAEADAEIARLRAALSNLVEDLNARAVGGFVDCGASVWMDANAALSPGAGEGGE